MNITEPWCMHRDHDEEWDITRWGDLPVRIFLQPCGGVRAEVER